MYFSSLSFKIAHIVQIELVPIFFKGKSVNDKSVIKKNHESADRKNIFKFLKQRKIFKIKNNFSKERTIFQKKDNFSEEIKIFKIWNFFQNKEPFS